MLICGILLGLVLVIQGVAISYKDLNWKRLFEGDMIVDIVKNLEGTPGVKLIMTVTASREQIWKTLIDYENFRDVFKNIEKIKVLEQNQQGAYVEFWIDAVLTKYHYVLYRHYETPLRRLTWRRVSGDLEKITGSWEIHDTPRPEAKLLIYQSYVQVETVLPKSWLRWGAIRQTRAMGRHLRKALEARAAMD
jgi:hypothetical protein